jgi:hypothetical protein
MERATGSHSSDDPWRARMGRLDEAAEMQHIRASLYSQAGPAVYLRTPARPLSAGRPTSLSDGLGYRALPIGAQAKTATPVSTFHLDISPTSRHPFPKLPKSVLCGRRIAIWPTRKEVSGVRRIPGVKRSQGGVWSLPNDHPFLHSALGQALASSIARCAALERRQIASPARALRQVLTHQRYVERSGRDAARAEDIEADQQGPIILGTIGETPMARAQFWRAANDAEFRRDARLQERIIGELPHWITPADRREILRLFGTEFGAHGLGWFAAAHLPDAHGDHRNYHFHMLVATRPTVSSGPGRSQDPRRSGAQGSDWHFADNKVREAQGPKWVTYLRTRYAEIVNLVCAEAARRDKRPVERLFFPGRGIEIGISSAPSPHLGPKRSAPMRREGRSVERMDRMEFFDAIEGCLRGLDHDRRTLSDLVIRKQLLLEFGARIDQIMTRRAEAIEKIAAAERALTMCDGFLKRILARRDKTRKASAPGRVDVPTLDLEDITWRFERLGMLTIAASRAFEPWWKFELDRRGSEPIEIAQEASTPLGLVTTGHANTSVDSEDRPRPVDGSDIIPAEIARASEEPAAPAHAIASASPPKMESQAVDHLSIGQRARAVYDALFERKVTPTVGAHRDSPVRAQSSADPTDRSRSLVVTTSAQQRSPTLGLDRVAAEVSAALPWLPPPIGQSAAVLRTADGTLFVRIGTFDFFLTENVEGLGGVAQASGEPASVRAVWTEALNRAFACGRAELTSAEISSEAEALRLYVRRDDPAKPTALVVDRGETRLTIKLSGQILNGPDEPLLAELDARLARARSAMDRATPSVATFARRVAQARRELGVKFEDLEFWFDPTRGAEFRSAIWPLGANLNSSEALAPRAAPLPYPVDQKNRAARPTTARNEPPRPTPNIGPPKPKPAHTRDDEWDR